MAVLGWLELSEQDQPPEEIWLDEEAITAHFRDVQDRYRSESGGGETVEDRPMTENNLARDLRRG